MGWLDKIIDKIPLRKIIQKIDKGAAVVQGNNIKSGLRQLLKANEDFEEQAKLHGAAHHDYVVQINKKVQRLLKDMEGRMLKEEIKNKFFDPILQSDKYSKATKNCLKGVLDQHIEVPSIKDDRAFVEDYIPNFFEAYVEFLEKEKNKRGLQSIKRLPFTKSQIKKAIFDMLNRFKRKEVGTKSTDKELLLRVYCCLIVYQPDDTVKKFNNNKSWDKNQPLAMKLAKELKEEYQKNMKEKLPDSILNERLVNLRLSMLK